MSFSALLEAASPLAGSVMEIKTALMDQMREAALRCLAALPVNSYVVQIDAFHLLGNVMGRMTVVITQMRQDARLVHHLHSVD
jgi:hypothetical protein